MDRFQSRMFGRVKLLRDSYTNGGLAIVLVAEQNEDDVITTLSVNLPDHTHRLQLDEFFPKTWSENAEIAREALASGVVMDTGRRISIPQGEKPVWRCL